MYPCQRLRSLPLERRSFLRQAGCGFGAIALAALWSQGELGSAAVAAESSAGDSLSARPTHFPAKAKSVIFLYMDGGPSQIDTFDPKPRLNAEHGKPFAMKI